MKRILLAAAMSVALGTSASASIPFELPNLTFPSTDTTTTSKLCLIDKTVTCPPQE